MNTPVINTQIKEYAHPCPCGGTPVCERHNDHLWNDKYVWGYGYHCPICRNSVSVLGGGKLFALHHWNDKYPDGKYITGELRWEWLIMGGEEEGRFEQVAIDNGVIINPLTGAQLNHPFEIVTWIIPATRKSIRLVTPRLKKDKAKLLRDLQDFTGESLEETHYD